MSRSIDVVIMRLCVLVLGPSAADPCRYIIPTYLPPTTRPEKYPPTQPLTPEQMAQTAPTDIAGLIAQELARMHAMRVVMPSSNGGGGDGGDGSKRAVLWTKMEEWARLAEGACVPIAPLSCLCDVSCTISNQPRTSLQTPTSYQQLCTTPNPQNRHSLRRLPRAAAAAGGDRARAAAGGDGLAQGEVGRGGLWDDEGEGGECLASGLGLRDGSSEGHMSSSFVVGLICVPSTHLHTQPPTQQFVKELVFSHQDLLCGNILFNPDWCVVD